MSPEFPHDSEPGLTHQQITESVSEYYWSQEINPSEVTFAYPYTIKAGPEEGGIIPVVMKLEQAVSYCARHMRNYEMSVIIDTLDRLHQAAVVLEREDSAAFEYGKFFGEQLAPTEG